MKDALLTELQRRGKMTDLLEDVEVEHDEGDDGNDGRGEGRVADVAERVPPDVGRVQPQLSHVVLDAGLVVVAHLMVIVSIISSLSPIVALRLRELCSAPSSDFFTLL